MLVFHMNLGPHAGEETTDAEKYLRWMKESFGLSPEHEQKMREIVNDHAETDRVADEAAEKFAPGGVV